MRAAVLYELNKPLVVENLIPPKELLAGQVFVKVHASSICGAQIGEITGAKGEDKYLPHLLGHEGCGTVVEIGPGVTNVKINDLVVMHWRKGKGIDAQCPKYETYDGKIIGGGWITTFNDYAIISENRLTKVDNDMSSDVCALLGCAVTTGLGIVNNEAKLKIGESIAIAGCGGVGMNVIQGAWLCGADPVIAIDNNDNKLEMAEILGASEVKLIFDPKEILKIGNVDVFVDCTGNTDVIEAGYSIAKRTIFVGQPRYGKDLILHNMRKNCTGKILLDSQGGLTNPNEDIPRYVKLYKSGKLDLDSLIQHRIVLNDINDAIEGMINGVNIAKYIIEM